MTKTDDPKLNLTTHFQQIPLALVRGIAAARHPRRKRRDPENLIVERYPPKTEPYTEARILSRRDVR